MITCLCVPIHFIHYLEFLFQNTIPYIEQEFTRISMDPVMNLDDGISIRKATLDDKQGILDIATGLFCRTDYIVPQIDNILTDPTIFPAVAVHKQTVIGFYVHKVSVMKFVIINALQVQDYLSYCFATQKTNIRLLNS